MRRATRIDFTDGEALDLAQRLSVQPLIVNGVAYVLGPVRCGVLGCKRIAVKLDSFMPFMGDLNRCRTHARRDGDA